MRPVRAMLARVRPHLATLLFWVAGSSSAKARPVTARLLTDLAGSSVPIGFVFLKEACGDLEQPGNGRVAASAHA